MVPHRNTGFNLSAAHARDSYRDFATYLIPELANR